MSKFSDQVAQGMSEILENKSFYKPFNKTTVKTASNDNVFNITELEMRYPDAYNALLDSDKEKFKFYTFHVNEAGKVCAKEVGGTDEYLFTHSPNHAPTWVKIAESDEYAFELYAAKKKKEDDEDKDDKKSKKSDKKDKDADEKDDKKEKSDKKDKKSKKDDEEDEEDDKKSKKKKSKKDDEDKNDAMALIFAAKKSKEDKKDGEDKNKSEKYDDKEDKPKGKKKQFPFWLKKKKAGKDCEEGCDCEECMEANDGMFASAIRHIVESFTKTSSALDNMGLEKSSIATMAILNHIIEEAAYVKMAKTSKLEEKLHDLKEKFKKMHEKDEAYDADVAEELDKRITSLEEQIKKEKKDSNDVRGTDLLLGLDDPEAQEGFLDHNLDDPHSSAALEEILSKNPSLVDEIAPRLKSQFSDQVIEDQLKNRIKSRLPSVIETPEDSDLSGLMDYQRGIPKENSDFSEIMKAYTHKVPENGKLPNEFVERRVDPNRTKIDELNTKDGMDDDELINKMVKELQKNHADYDDNGEIDCTHLAEEMADKLGLLEGDDDKVPDYVFECATEAAEKYENMHEKEEDDYNDSEDAIVNAFNLAENWVKIADNFEDEGDGTTVTQDDLKSVLDVIGGYSDQEISDRESSMSPNDLDAYTNCHLYTSPSPRDS